MLLLQGLHSQTAYSLVLVGLDDIQPPNYAEPPIILQVLSHQHFQQPQALASCLCSSHKHARSVCMSSAAMSAAMLNI